MKLFNRSKGTARFAIVMAAALCAGVAGAQDYASLGISEVVASADRSLLRGDYRAAIPALREVIERTKDLRDPEGRGTCQTCRFQLARAHFQVGETPAGMKVLETYLENEPRNKERLALRMMAQGHFDTKSWDKIEEIASRLLEFPDLTKEDRYNANLLLGQARFRMEKWKAAVQPLSYAARNAEETHVRELCQIMMVRALVEAEDWQVLFSKLPAIYHTDTKYDISLNLTLMKAGRSLFEKEDYLNALFLYRWVLPRERLLAFAEKKLAAERVELAKDVERGITPTEIEERQGRIDGGVETMKQLTELPAYEDEVTFRIGQIYAEVRRYWEAYVLFDKLYQQDRNSEIGEAAMLQSVLIFYDVNEAERAEERILIYLNENPGGQYARTMLTMMARDNLLKQNFARVVELRPYLDSLPVTNDPDELGLQADLHYMLAFGYFQTGDHPSAGEQFTTIIDRYPESVPAPDAQYYRGMSFMMRADYANALPDFQAYQEKNEFGEHLAVSLFREAVCEFGLGNIEAAEAGFTKFIEGYPEDALVSEAYSLRGDIEASKEATNDDPDTLDRALSDYRKGIDKASEPKQASYAAFQAAKVYKLEYKWQEIIDLMDYYLDRWEEEADVAESMFWKGQAQLELEQVADAVSGYIDAIERFGNDPAQLGVDKIIHELVKIANTYLTEEERAELSIRIKLKLTNVDARAKVLQLRLNVAQALLEGEEVAAAFGAELLEDGVDLDITSSASLALMCDAAVSTGDTNAMDRLSTYFIETYDESELLWHAYRAQAIERQAAGDDAGVLASVEEAQGMFGAEPQMGWAQMMRADTEFKKKEYGAAYDSYNMLMGVAEWRGELYAEAMYGMGQCKLAEGDLEAAHALFQRIYLLFKSYADGEWAAKGYIAAAGAAFKLGEEDKAIKTLQAMLEDEYTNKSPLAEQVRAQLKNNGVE